MIPKSMPSGSTRGWHRFSEKILCEGQGALEWVRPVSGARALESVAVPAASGELSLALENPGERV